MIYHRVPAVVASRKPYGLTNAVPRGSHRRPENAWQARAVSVVGRARLNRQSISGLVVGWLLLYETLPALNQDFIVI